MVFLNDFLDFPSFESEDGRKIIMQTGRGTWIHWISTALPSLEPDVLTCEESILLLLEAHKNKDEKVEIDL